MSGIGNYIGMIDKATIFVPSLEGKEMWDNALALFGGASATLMGTMQAFSESMIRDGAAGAMTIMEMGGAGGAVGAQAVKKMSITAAQALNTYNKIEVQYNPKTLSITGLGGRARSYSAGLGNGAENGIVQYDNKTTTTLSCELVFTNVNISDAFMTEDISNFNLNSAISMGANVTKRLLGMSPSVQPIVDGFLSILTSGYTRMIIFAWGATVFRGELIRVDCNYKMFNKRGDPIVATVNITIRQAYDKTFGTPERHWYKQLNKTFKDINDIF